MQDFRKIFVRFREIFNALYFEIFLAIFLKYFEHIERQDWWNVFETFLETFQKHFNKDFWNISWNLSLKYFCVFSEIFLLQISISVSEIFLAVFLKYFWHIERQDSWNVFETFLGIIQKHFKKDFWYNFEKHISEIFLIGFRNIFVKYFYSRFWNISRNISEYA